MRIKGDQLTDMDPVELLQLRPVLERSTLRRAKRTRRKGDKKAKKAAKKDAPATPVRVSPTSPLTPPTAEAASESKPQCPGAPPRPRPGSLLAHLGPDAPPVALLPALDGGGAAPPGFRDASVLVPRGAAAGGFAEAFAEGHYAHLPGIAFHLAPAPAVAAPAPGRAPPPGGDRGARWAPTPGASSFSVFQRKAPPAGAAGVLCPGLYASPFPGYAPFSIVVSHDAAYHGQVAAAAADARDGGDGAPAPWPPPAPAAAAGLGPDGAPGPVAAAFFAAPPPEAPLPSRPHSPDGHWRANLEDDDVHIFPDDFSDIFPPEEPFLL